eukprot:GHVU01069007.1.p1 GENE.GHVU01069007.1~~GHVU01069007.1.p1  ORF type:complete len:129 (-),score=9.49 GHVU01069007.1:114-500(-)
MVYGGMCARGRLVTISLADVQTLLTDGKCYLCGRPDCSTMEREDNEQDYVHGNVKLSCSPCNQFKGKKTVEQTKALAKKSALMRCRSGGRRRNAWSYHSVLVGLQSVVHQTRVSPFTSAYLQTFHPHA